jgi:hypothetical protein
MADWCAHLDVGKLANGNPHNPLHVQVQHGQQLVCCSHATVHMLAGAPLYTWAITLLQAGGCAPPGAWDATRRGTKPGAADRSCAQAGLFPWQLWRVQAYVLQQAPTLGAIVWHDDQRGQPTTMCGM